MSGTIVRWSLAIIVGLAAGLLSARGGAPLIRKGATRPATFAVVVESPTAKGIALLRYLSPTPARFKASAMARASARSELWKG